MSSETTLEMIPEQGVVELRIKLDEKDQLAKAQKALGIELPDKPWVSIYQDTLSSHCIGIDRFMVMGRVSAMEGAAENLSAEKVMALYQGDAYQMFRLQGADIAHIVARIAPVNIYEERFSEPFSRWLNMEDLHVLMISNNWPTSAEFLVPRSFADYFVAFLEPLIKPDTDLKLYQDYIAAL